SQHTGLIAYDTERSSFLERRGFKIIRFWNHEVLAQTNRVREAIGQRIEELMAGSRLERTIDLPQQSRIQSESPRAGEWPSGLPPQERRPCSRAALPSPRGSALA
ncbi:MAG: DUF559 domain-containing protein, partial [Acidobacteria bacterium]|nr:DUF559 domain-containing protein [Acidobacteriota bacterium]